MEEQFNDLMPVIRTCALGVCRDILGVDVQLSEDWRVVSRVENHSTFGATVGFANQGFQGACTLGLSTEAAAVFLPGLDDETIFDALGELGNTICGMLDDSPEFLAIFGLLEQTPPLFSRGGAWLPRAKGVMGSLLYNGELLQFGCSLRPVNFVR
jgi:hypothetical protein